VAILKRQKLKTSTRENRGWGKYKNARRTEKYMRKTSPYGNEPVGKTNEVGSGAENCDPPSLERKKR